MMQHELKITGTGTLEMKPDLCTIYFPVSITRRYYELAVNDLNDNIKSIKKILELVKINKEELKTIDFSVEKDTRWDSANGKYVFNGFKAQHKVKVDFPVGSKLIAEFLGMLVENTEDMDFEVSFSVKNPKIHESELIKRAISNAKKSAEIIALESGVKLKEIVKIDYYFSEVVFSRQKYTVNYDMCVNESTFPDFEPNGISGSKSITMVWAIE
ncbi:MAG: SIMPL domain-containing protein [Candidatus Marinimicrobia bacterium]|nr:SIMPL domain-containing protein [Candidatus Neomarinimicrobiota bacterium]